jgi:N-acetylmuramoyl-L-alanine amidase
MMITVKRRTLLIIAAVIVGVAVTLGLAGLGVSAAGARAEKIDKVVVIDAGHGGRDGGVTGVATGVKESDINLSIAKSVRRFLEDKGYTVVMTRSTSDGLYGMATGDFKAKDMNARKTAITEANADLVVSIHQNSFPSPTVRGPQVFYAPTSETGVQMAGVMQNILNASLGNSRVAKKGDFFILQCSPAPSLLIECGFLSNRDEEALLVSAAYQEKVAYTVFTGIHTIFYPTAETAV